MALNSKWQKSIWNSKRATLFWNPQRTSKNRIRAFSSPQRTWQHGVPNWQDWQMVAMSLIKSHQRRSWWGPSQRANSRRYGVWDGAIWFENFTLLWDFNRTLEVGGDEGYHLNALVCDKLCMAIEFREFRFFNCECWCKEEKVIYEGRIEESIGRRDLLYVYATNNEFISSLWLVWRVVPFWLRWYEWMSRRRSKRTPLYLLNLRRGKRSSDYWHSVTNYWIWIVCKTDERCRDNTCGASSF